MGALLLAAALGCSAEPCKSGPPSVVLEVRALDQARAARSLSVQLTVAEHRWQRDFPLSSELMDGVTTVGAEIVPAPSGPFELRATVRAYEGADPQSRLLAQGEQRYSAAANACNRFTLDLGPLTPGDGGVDAAVEGGLAEAGALDGGVDGAPDAVEPDATPDATDPEDTGLEDGGELDAGCPDDDGDGVCNADDICPGFDDNQDGDQDGVPDDCDNCPAVRNRGQDDTNGVAAFAVPFAFQWVSNGVAYPLGDDEFVAPVPLGFDFVFFGQTYSEVLISSNGFVSFDLGAGDGCCNGAFPDPTPPNALIALAWTDLFPPNGTLTSTTVGQAPDRQFIVTYDAVPWCCDVNGPTTTQVVLFEGSNAIEIHTLEQPSGQNYSRGIEDEAGVWAAFVGNQRIRDYALSMDAVGFTTDLSADGVGDACSNATDVPF